MPEQKGDGLEGGPVRERSAAVDELALWESMTSRRDHLVRARLILHYLPFARYMARAVQHGAGTDYLSPADFVQFATIGLIEAVDRFDPSHGAPFRAFAEKRIRGAILNGIADASEMHAQLSYRRRLRRERMQDLAAAKDAKQSDVFANMVEMALGIAVGYMLEGTTMFQQAPDGATLGYGDSGELAARSDMFQALVSHLPDMERAVVELHYWHNLQFSDVASTLGLSRGRISQLHAHALSTLRQLARDRPNLDLRM